MIRTLAITAALLFAVVIAFSSASARGRVDQSAIGPWWGDMNLDLSLKQTFRPEATVLTGITVGLDRMGQESSTSVTLTVRSGGLDGPVIATSPRLIDNYAPGQPFDFYAGTHLEHFEFATPAATVPGQLYVIQLDVDNGGLGWADVGYDIYPNGNAYWRTQAITGDDFMFQTCGNGDGKPCKQKTELLAKPTPPGHSKLPGCIDFNSGTTC